MFELIAGAKNQTNGHPERTLKSQVLQELEGRSEMQKSLGRGTWSRVVLAAARPGGHRVSGDNNGTGKDGSHGTGSALDTTYIIVLAAQAALTPAM